jgi:hypothetical protein
MPDNEPENVEQPKVDAGGKVLESKKEAIDVEAYNKLKKDFEDVSEVARSVYQYVKEDEGGTREFDVPRMIDDLGYEVTELRKKGQKPKEEKPSDPKEIEKVNKQMVEEFNKDPEGYLKKHNEKLLEQTRKEIENNTKPLAQKLRAREIEEMVTTVSSEFDDFEGLQDDIAKLARKNPPKDADDLRDLYHAAKGRKQHSSGSGLAGSNRGSQKAGRGTPRITPEEQIRAEILSFAGKGETPEGKAMNRLLGKSVLPPIPGT